MIRKLAPHIVHQIAAGEVIERPASVLKELIENSLDAKASKIFIEHQEGGLKQLSVDDNGFGIEEADFPLIFEAHATSKLRQLEDFDRLDSFGFRGEALCSIASVARVQVWSSREEAVLGGRAEVSFGGPLRFEAADKRRGTRMDVFDLFSRHPARLKFMKTEKGESMALNQVWKRYVLAYPDIHWSIKDLGSNREIQMPKQNRLCRTLWFYGAEQENEWLHFEDQSDQWKFDLIGIRPRFVGKHRAGIQLFLNNRPFKDSKLEFALRRAYESFTENPRELSMVAFIEGSPELFDVNVHPMKSEVRFVNPDLLFSQLVSVIRKHLDSDHRSLLQTAWSAPMHVQQTEMSDEVVEVSADNAEPVTSERPTIPSVNRSFAPQNFSAEAIEHFYSPLKVSAKLFEEKSEYEYIGSLDDTYLLTKLNGDLILFDQHALHERILYERLLAEFKKGSRIPSQRLLFPMPIHFSGVEVLLEQEEILDRLGFELRLWNDGKVQLVSAPSILKRDHKDVLAKLAESTQLPIETLANEVLSTLACHSAVRAHDRLDRAQVDQLLRDFQSKDSLGHCPHGRPTFVRFQLRDLEKLFHRVL